MRRLFILGHPGLYGGAATELHSQIYIWKKFENLELHIIPTQLGYKNEPLYQEMVNLGVIYHSPFEWDAITKDDAVISFCCSHFLENLELIASKTSKTLWVNCMTWLFDKEKEKAKLNLIKYYLYQRPQVLRDHKRWLTKLGNTEGEFIHFIPYFNSDRFYNCREKEPDEKIHIGRISRQDADKFSKDTLHIYEYMVSPKMKQGHFLGFDYRSEAKIGKTYEWIKTYENHKELPVTDFYKRMDFLVQPMDTTENLPRIGFEAMFSGVPLVVDNRGGWQYMIEHGVSGFLCDHPRDFIYWGSRLAYEPELRYNVAQRAITRAAELASEQTSFHSWDAIFNRVFN